MKFETITCPRCGEEATLFTSRNGTYLAEHGARSSPHNTMAFRHTRDEAVADMVRPYSGGGGSGACPQAWRHDLIEDGEPDTHATAY